MVVPCANETPKGDLPDPDPDGNATLLLRSEERSATDIEVVE